MGSRPETVEFLTDQMRNSGTVTAKKMFGEYGIYCDGILVALICDDDLYVKATPAGRQLAPDAGLAPPYPGAKPALLIPTERWDDHEWLSAVVGTTRLALAAS